MDCLSLLQTTRQKYALRLPSILECPSKVHFFKGEKTSALKDAEELRAHFRHTFGQPIISGQHGKDKTTPPLRIGVVLSGGQAAGGHNVISGIFDVLQQLNPQSTLVGFLDGPDGIVHLRYKLIEKAELDLYRNQGGFDLIGSGRTKIETEEQLEMALSNVTGLKLDGLVVVGGDDSNTNAAILAEYFLSQNCPVKVVGVPKTIDGDLKNAYVPISFGFDSACKTFSELIGNIARDALSAKKYYHFIKLMGRSASHIALECALKTHPNLTLIGEEVSFHQKNLLQIAHEICDLICQRAETGKNYGIILVPEGLVEFVPEMGTLIREINHLVSTGTPAIEDIKRKLTSDSLHCFQALPETIQKQLFLDRDPHGNVHVSMIETERLLMEIVKKVLKDRKDEGSYTGKFNPILHFFGYEGRAGFPSNFDAHYCYALGQTAALLIRSGFTGYMSCVGDLKSPVEQWTISGVPLTMLMNMEVRHSKSRPVIQKALVQLDGAVFDHFNNQRHSWRLHDDYKFPGPIQFVGDPLLTDSIPFTVSLDSSL